MIACPTSSTLQSFLSDLEHLVKSGKGPFLMSTTDSLVTPEAYAQFVRDADLFPQADVVLGLTSAREAEKSLRVAMRGNEGTGLLPKRIVDNPEAFEIIAMTNTGFDSEFVTSGLYYVRPSILKEKDAVLGQGFSALRHYLGHLLKFGYRIYGVIDNDGPAPANRR